MKLFIKTILVIFAGSLFAQNQMDDFSVDGSRITTNQWSVSSTSDSTNYSRFSLRFGIGSFKGVRLGLDYQLSDHVSTSGSFSFIDLISCFPTIGIKMFNFGIEYHFPSYNQFLFDTSFSYWTHELIEPVFFIIPSIGAIKNKPFDIPIALQGTVGFGFHTEINEKLSFNIYPHLDFVIKIRLRR